MQGNEVKNILELLSHVTSLKINFQIHQGKGHFKKFEILTLAEFTFAQKSNCKKHLHQLIVLSV